ncbi:MAG: hypothetical protein MUE67_12505 [Anaerolineales bacterium]|jgi:hypothetical protein|nr:hypothetical protein [Anaerolineales bacterium]
MAKDYRSADELVKRILADPKTWERIQADHATELLRLAKEVGEDIPPTPPLESDVFIYRMVVAVIGAVAIVAVIGAILVVALDVSESTPLLTALVSISSAAIGALAGLLSPMGFRR